MPKLPIRERLAAFIGGRDYSSEIDNLNESVKSLYRGYLEGPWQLPPEELIRQLKEQAYDTGIIQDIILRMQYDVIGQYGDGQLDEAERTRSVLESRRLWKYSPLGQWSIWLWTNYGFGSRIEVIPQDEAARTIEEQADKPANIGVWDEFWTADRNEAVLADDNIHQMSNDLLVDGNLFLAYAASTVDGQCTVMEIDPTEITEIITHPDNDQWPLFYKRQWTDKRSNVPRTLYYSDWMAFFDGVLDKVYIPTTGVGQRVNGVDEPKTLAAYLEIKDNQRADKINAGDTLGQGTPGTVIVIQHIHYNQKERRSLWGWPLLLTTAPWERTHRQFMRNRLAVSAAKAMYVRDLEVASGSRGVASVIDTIASNLSNTQALDTNPPAVAGSTFTHNQAVKPTDLQMKTGADDAKTDEEMFSWYTLISMGVFPHYAGKGDAYRLATATSMERPIELQFSRYRLFWSTQFRRMVRIVLQMRETYSNGSITYESYDAEISTDKLVQVDLAAVTEGLGRTYREIIMPLIDLGLLPDEVVKLTTAFALRTIIDAAGGGSVIEELTVEDFEDDGEPETEEGEAPSHSNLEESHKGQLMYSTCPMCGHTGGFMYPDHPPSLRVCANCEKTYDSAIENLPDGD